MSLVNAKVNVVVTIKGRTSERLPGKNFITLAGKPMYAWVLDPLAAMAPDNWRVFISSEEQWVLDDVRDYYSTAQFGYHLRPPWYASDAADYSNVLSEFACQHTDCQYYLSRIVNAPFLKLATIFSALTQVVEGGYDSAMFGRMRTGFYWFNGRPTNHTPYRPGGMQRTQDVQVFKECPGSYIVKRDILLSRGVRVGDKPLMYEVSEREMVKINYQSDLDEAEKMVRADKCIEDRTLDLSKTSYI